ncbi:GNAT family N-acetyltransferase [Halomarina ordinaria]|uniref:GNAT family N-acetyltransferase n=1 Tax=Halomarina ordinaria TaxID=3033939 RepID=A0ABD5U9X4_9EURY|nr:GNAT family N-acetyltransferase [Halomarina sp. PSRA2]
MSDATVGRARPDEALAVRRVLDAALLDVDDLDDAIRRGAVFVARRKDRVVGALVLDDEHVTAVAVRRRRRARGVGTALVERALSERGRLTADFREAVRPFYASLGFTIEEREDGRLWGRLDESARD